MKPSLPLFNRPGHHLYSSIIASKVAQRDVYVVVDPVDPSGLLYLTPGQYTRLVNTALSHDQLVVVLLRPGESLSTPHENGSVSGDTSGSGTSITPGTTNVVRTRGPDIIRSMGSAWRRFRSWYHSSSDSPLLALTNRNVRTLFRTWALLLIARSGAPYQSETHYRHLMSVVGYFSRTYRHHGVMFTIMKMKVALIAVNRYLAGTPITETRSFGPPLALAHGLPSFIPADVRRLLRTRHLPFIRTYCSFLGIFKGIKGELPGFQSHSTIRLPKFGFRSEVISEVHAFLPLFWKWATANCNKLPSLVTNKLYRTPHSGPNDPNAVHGAIFDLMAWELAPVNHFLTYCRVTGNDFLIRTYEDIKVSAERMLLIYGNYSTAFERLGLGSRPILALGKLAEKEEAAGKVRLFAIVDYWTQCAMKPLHEKLFSVLRSLESDGTFDQEAAVKSFVERYRQLGVYSFDLSAATDTIPLQLTIWILSGLVGSRVAEAWGNLLVDREFYFPPFKDADGVLHVDFTTRYTRGQPMGALSSWAALAITHHFVIQLAAYRIGKFPTSEYRVLGDDICIAGSDLSDAYLNLARSVGFKLNNKGIVSPRTDGDAITNFANQTYLGGDNISPISLREELTINSIGARVESIRRLISRGFIDPSKGFLRSLSASANIRLSRMKGDLETFSRGSIPRALFGLLLVLSYPSNSRYSDQTGPWSSFLALIKGPEIAYGNPLAFQTDKSVSADSLGYSERTLISLLSSTYASTISVIEKSIRDLYASQEGHDTWLPVWNFQYQLFLLAAYAAERGSSVGALVQFALTHWKAFPNGRVTPVYAYAMVLLHTLERRSDAVEQYGRLIQLRKELIQEEKTLAHIYVSLEFFSAKMSSLNEIIQSIPRPLQFTWSVQKYRHSPTNYLRGLYGLYHGWGQPLLTGGPVEPLNSAWFDPRFVWGRVPEIVGPAWMFDGVFKLPRIPAFTLPHAASPLEREARSERRAISIAMPFRILENSVTDFGIRIEEYRSRHSIRVDDEWHSRTSYPWVGKPGSPSPLVKDEHLGPGV